MKKLYSIALAAAVAFSTTAGERQLASGTVRPSRTADIKTEAIQKTIPAARMKTPAKAAASVTDIEKADIWSYYGLLQNDSKEQEKPVEIKIINETTGEASITLMGNEDYSLKATFDAAAGTITVPNKQYLFTDDDGDVYFYIKSLTSEGKLVNGASAAAATVGTYSNGAFIFPESDIWAAGDPGNEAVGWYFLTADNIFMNDPFVSLGNGQFIENIIYSLFTSNENTTAATVEVLSDGQGRYIVVDPFKSLYTALNFKSTSPELLLDATDPDNVSIPLSSTGISGGDTDGLYTYFSESWYCENFNEEFDPALAITKTVEGDNVTITIPFKATTVLAQTSYNLYYGSKYVSTLTFKESTSGIGPVVTEESDAPAVYYNLQGVRVENPVSGFVIRVQGGKATKMLVK